MTVRRPLRVTLIVTAVVVVLVGGLVVVDGLVRSEVADRARGEIGRAIGLDPAQVDVEVHGWSALWQLGTGRWELITGRADDATVAGVPADLQMSIEGLPTNEVDAISKVELVAVLGEDAIETLVAQNSGFDVDTVALAPPLLELTSTPNVLGFEVPVVLGVGLAAADHGIDVTVETLNVSGVEVDLDAASQYLGPLATQFLAPHSVCLADALPTALSIESVRVGSEGARITVIGTDVAVADLGAGTGTCAEA